MALPENLAKLLPTIIDNIKENYLDEVGEGIFIDLRDGSSGEHHLTSKLPSGDYCIDNTYHVIYNDEVIFKQLKEFLGPLPIRKHLPQTRILREICSYDLSGISFPPWRLVELEEQVECLIEALVSADVASIETWRLNRLAEI